MKVSFDMSDGYTLQKYIDSESNTIKSVFYHNQIKCRHYIYNTPRSHQLKSYHLIKKDLEHVLSSIQALINMQIKSSLSDGQLDKLWTKESHEATIMKAVYHSIIITYAKCFASTSSSLKKVSHGKEKSRGVKLESSELFKDNPDFIFFHDVLMNHRNEYIAHGGITDLESARFMIVFHPQRKGVQFCVDENHYPCFNTVFLKKLIPFIQFILAYLEKIKNKKFTALYDSEITKKDADVIFEKSVLESSSELFHKDAPSI